jgi:hypothetical protein
MDVKMNSKHFYFYKAKWKLTQIVWISTKLKRTCHTFLLNTLN